MSQQTLWLWRVHWIFLEQVFTLSETADSLTYQLTKCSKSCCWLQLFNCSTVTRMKTATVAASQSFQNPNHLWPLEATSQVISLPTCKLQMTRSLNHNWWTWRSRVLRLALVKVPHTQILSSRLDFSESELGLKNHLLLISAQVPLVGIKHLATTLPVVTQKCLQE